MSGWSSWNFSVAANEKRGRFLGVAFSKNASKIGIPSRITWKLAFMVFSWSASNGSTGREVHSPRIPPLLAQPNIRRAVFRPAHRAIGGADLVLSLPPPVGWAGSSLRTSVKGDKPTFAKAPSGKAQKGRADARSRPAVHAAIHNYEGSCYIGSTRRRPWDGFTREQIFPS